LLVFLSLTNHTDIKQGQNVVHLDDADGERFVAFDLQNAGSNMLKQPVRHGYNRSLFKAGLPSLSPERLVSVVERIESSPIEGWMKDIEAALGRTLTGHEQSIVENRVRNIRMLVRLSLRDTALSNRHPKVGSQIETLMNALEKKSGARKFEVDELRRRNHEQQAASLLELLRKIRTRDLTGVIAATAAHEPILISEIGGQRQGQLQGPRTVDLLKEAISDPAFVDVLKRRLREDARLTGSPWNDADQRLLLDTLLTLGFNNRQAHRFVSTLAAEAERIIIVDKDLDEKIAADRSGFLREELRRLNTAADGRIRITLPVAPATATALAAELVVYYPNATVISSAEGFDLQTIFANQPTGDSSSAVVVCPTGLVEQLGRIVGNRVISHDDLLPPTQYFDIANIASRLRHILIAA
jgi:hypothetical protein